MTLAGSEQTREPVTVQQVGDASTVSSVDTSTPVSTGSPVVLSTQESSVETTGTATATETTTVTTPETTPPVEEPAPAPGPTAPAEPAETTTPPAAPAEPTIVEQPAPTEYCWMDDSDPVNHPNGREVCSPTPWS